MKRLFWFLLLWFCTGFSGFAEDTAAADLILLVDVSSAMSPHYRAMLDYATGPLLKEYLRIGDTFHLLSFAGGARLELARRVEGVGDVETIVGRMHLLYPIEPSGPDLNAALDFAGAYIAALPGPRPKVLVLITGRDTAAAAESSRFALMDTELRVAAFPLSSPAPPPVEAPPAVPTPPPAVEPPAPAEPAAPPFVEPAPVTEAPPVAEAPLAGRPASSPLVPIRGEPLRRRAPARPPQAGLPAAEAPPAVPAAEAPPVAEAPPLVEAPPAVPTPPPAVEPPAPAEPA
ncbi:MAG: VWA domain-containing protein, partial [Spirochaetaceae bacterium]|nr:VWA domain-containing protein [Spirochaetaceae bacterium]